MNTYAEIFSAQDLSELLEIHYVSANELIKKLGMQPCRKIGRTNVYSFNDFLHAINCTAEDLKHYAAVRKRLRDAVKQKREKITGID